MMKIMQIIWKMSKNYQNPSKYYKDATKTIENDENHANHLENDQNCSKFSKMKQNHKENQEYHKKIVKHEENIRTTVQSIKFKQTTPHEAYPPYSTLSSAPTLF